MTNAMTTSQWSSVVPVENLSQWQIQAVKGVVECSHLGADWDTYGSPAPSAAVVNAALRLVTTIGFEYLPAPDVVPVCGGGIQFEWVANERELELEILPDRSIEYLKSSGGHPVDEGQVKTSAHIDSLLTWLTG